MREKGTGLFFNWTAFKISPIFPNVLRFSVINQRLNYTAALLAVIFLITACQGVEDEIPVGQFTNTTVSFHGGPMLLVHFMPWYRGPSNITQENNSSSYGGHWTRWGAFNPTQHSNDGKAQIFANQYPLTGPYHSSNIFILEYQASLMKIAGIDGVIFDWYGAYDSNDFGENHGYTTAMVDVLRRAELLYSVMYEDNTLNMMNNQNPAPVTSDTISIGRYSFDWAQINWFAYDPLYVRYEGRPVIMCFGPQHFKQKAHWDNVFYNVKPSPIFIDLDNHYSVSNGSFPWPPMWASENGVLTQTHLGQYLDQFYNQKAGKTYKVASVFSAFDDAYANSYGELAYDDGANFDYTWNKAVEFNPNIVQIVTWNDYGEGTIIEPTIERGYNELEYIQDRVKEYNPGFPFTAEDLRWPLEFYKLRYTQTVTGAQETAIAEATEALFAGNVALFRSRAADVGVTVDINDLKPLLRY